MTSNKWYIFRFILVFTYLYKKINSKNVHPFSTQFESEKFTSAADQDMQFANIAGKHKNPNDDLEDIFADKVRKNISEHDVEKKERDRAIRDHQEMERTLNACDKCFDSPKLEKQLIVSLGKNVYLSLPWHEGLTSGMKKKSFF